MSYEGRFDRQSIEVAYTDDIESVYVRRRAEVSLIVQRAAMVTGFQEGAAGNPMKSCEVKGRPVRYEHLVLLSGTGPGDRRFRYRLDKNHSLERLLGI